MSALKASDFVAAWTSNQLVLVTSNEDPAVCRVVEARDLPSITEIWPGHAIPLGIDVCHLPTLEEHTAQARQLLWKCHSYGTGGEWDAQCQLVDGARNQSISRGIVKGSAESWVPDNRHKIDASTTVDMVLLMALNNDLTLLHAGDVADALERLRNP